MAIAGLALTVWGVSTLVPAPEPVVRENGRGGPAEMPLSAALGTGAMDIARQSTVPPGSIQGSFIRTRDDLPAFAELGPVFSPANNMANMVIGSGQSFYEALAARGVGHEDIMTIVKDTRSFRNLERVRSGEEFKVDIAPDGGLRSLGYDLDVESYVTWERAGDTYVRRDGTYPVEHLLKGVSGTIENSLYLSLQKIGAPLSLAAKMNDIMGWDVDFKRDLRQGDSFRILYEEVWKDGKLVRTGAIEALELVNRGQKHTAFLFTEGDRPRYYDDEGKSMQKQLLRAPLNYSRISDRFTHRRYHPVLKKWMPHLGVDYAAPLGTPVRAGGDGVVLVAGSKKGNGRYIRIRHTNREYETYYLHLSRFAKGIRKGTEVAQGDIIGYVGATGYATGPHLDYRVKRRGEFVNPRRLKSPAAKPVAEDLMPRFAALAARYSESLADLPADQPVAVLPVQLWDPPAWDRSSYAQAALPLVRNMANGG